MLPGNSNHLSSPLVSLQSKHAQPPSVSNVQPRRVSRCTGAACRVWGTSSELGPSAGLGLCMTTFDVLRTSCPCLCGQRDRAAGLPPPPACLCGWIAVWCCQAPAPGPGQGSACDERTCTHKSVRQCASTICWKFHVLQCGCLQSRAAVDASCGGGRGCTRYACAQMRVFTAHRLAFFLFCGLFFSSAGAGVSDSVAASDTASWNTAVSSSTSSSLNTEALLGCGMASNLQY